DSEFAFNPFAVQQNTDASRGVAHMDERCIIAGIVADDTALLRQLAADHSFDFFRVVATVSAGCNQDCHIAAPDAWHFGKQSLDHDLPWLSARDVAYGDSNFLAWPIQVSHC